MLELLAALCAVLLLIQIYLLTRLENKMTALDDKLSTLEADVAANASAEQSAISLLTGLVQALNDAIGAGGNSSAQLARVQAVIDGIETQTAALSAAVVANTPPAP